MVGAGRTWLEYLLERCNWVGKREKDGKSYDGSEFSGRQKSRIVLEVDTWESQRVEWYRTKMC